MSLLLAPYNDSMRLGMGFNSYTQTMCIDGAVDVKDQDKVETESPSQVVTYSSKFVERLSDIVSSLNISYSSAIQKGTIEVAGNGNSIDEDKIKSSDINLIVSVQVINQTTTVKDTAEFKEMAGVVPGTAVFNDTFGDCYISGFIQGGDFSSIISMRSLDRSKTNSVVRSIKKMTKNSESEEFSLDSYNSSGLSSSSALKDTEITISVNWMGGGQIKDSATTWDFDSVYKAAAAFPANVAKTPQKTWAILTKYKANRDFNTKVVKYNSKALEYDSIASYTAELFNNFMEYKQLLKKVQDVISNGDQYTKGTKPKSIPVHIGTLVSVRTALRNEMNKIVAVVNVLAKKPELLSQENSFKIVSRNELVRQIMDEAIAEGPESKVIYDTTTSKKPPTQEAAAKTEKAETATKPSEDAADGYKIDLSALIAPEVWGELLPIRTSPLSSDQDDASTSKSGTAIPTAPTNDNLDLIAKGPKKLKILAATCGLQDVTESLQGRVKDELSLTIPRNEIDALASNALYKNLKGTFVKSLSFIYQYGDGPMRICSANHDKQATDSVQVTETSTHAIVKARPWTKESWSVISLVYGGKILNEEAKLLYIDQQIKRDYESTKSQIPCRRFHFTNDSIGQDPFPGINKTGVIFYKTSDSSPVRAAVAPEGQLCSLTDQQMLFEPKVDPQIALFNTTSFRYSVTFKGGTFNVPATDVNFLRFDNGVYFVYHPDGNLAVYRDGQGRLYYAGQKKTSTPGRNLIMQEDGNLVSYSANGALWSTGTEGNSGARLILSSEDPYIEIFRSDGGSRLFNSWGKGLE